MELFHFNRRQFLKSSSALAAYSYLGALGLDLISANDGKKVGLIGCGWYGKSDLLRLIQVANVQVTAMCDVDSRMLDGAVQLVKRRSNQKEGIRKYKDYLSMLASEELDIVIIGTPDHWHALQAIAAMKAGAHVYLQKPVSKDVLEGEAVLKVALETGKKIQVGTQRRSTPHLIEAKEKVIDSGLLGKIAHIEICSYYHMRFKGNPAVEAVPEFFDYNLWCGPAPLRPFDGLPHRRWRAYMEYGNGIVGDMCVHMLDTVRWMLGLGWPKQISSSGGIFVDTESNANISDTQTAIFEFDELNVVWQHRTWGMPRDSKYPWAFKIYGENGVLKGDVHKFEYISHNGRNIFGEALYEKEQFPEDLKEKDIELHAAPATRRHMLDFLSAIETSAEPIAKIEEGHISSASCILANMSMEIGRPLRYDPYKQIVTNDEEATQLLMKPYRSPWIHPSLSL